MTDKASPLDRLCDKKKQVPACLQALATLWYFATQLLPNPERMFWNQALVSFFFCSQAASDLEDTGSP